MELREEANGCLIDTARYTARIRLEEMPVMDITCGGRRMMRIPLVSGVSMPESDEDLRSFRVEWYADPPHNGVECRIRAESSLWSDREFAWNLQSDVISMRHAIFGSGRLAKCFFFSNGVSANHANGTSPGGKHNTLLYLSRCFSPRANHGDTFHFNSSLPQSLGVINTNVGKEVYDPTHMSNGLFCPPPLQLAFGAENAWVGIGRGEKPGGYLFNNFDYTGSRFAGSSFYVDYLGYKTVEGRFDSPEAAIHFGFSEYDVLRQHVEWLDESGYSTHNRFPSRPWHERPIFCGWGEQTAEAGVKGVHPGDLSRQDRYTEWLSFIDGKALPVGTVVIDDKWQREYGTLVPDEAKWPNMKSFIEARHANGQHVLLWIPVLHTEGIPPELCLRDGGTLLAADITNPAYEELLREGIRSLVRDYGVDGFKEDWIRGFVTKPGIPMHEPLHGIEMLRKYQLIVHDEAHRHREDALIETQTPHPVLRESSDMFRLNDVWFGCRDVRAVMSTRARIGRIAGWMRIDCDGACSAPLSEWWDYMQAQPGIGVPSLYLVSAMEATLEKVPDSVWGPLKNLWETYLENRLLPRT